MESFGATGPDGCALEVARREVRTTSDPVIYAVWLAGFRHGAEHYAIEVTLLETGERISVRFAVPWGTHDRDRECLERAARRVLWEGVQAARPDVYLLARQAGWVSWS